MNPRLALFIVSMVSCLVAGFNSFCQQAVSQEQGLRQSTALSLNVSSITAGPGQTVPMNISIIGAAENLFGFVLIVGLPSQFKLSSGFLNSNKWLVSLPELENLQLIVPDNFEGRFDIDVIFVLEGSKQRQTRSASVAIQQGPRPRDRLQSKPADSSVPNTSPEHDKNVTTWATEFLKADDVAAPEVGVPPLAADHKPPHQTSPNSNPNSDKAQTKREVTKFCHEQRYICRKVCRLRFRDRDNEHGCVQRCERWTTRCRRTGCYRWTEPDFTIAEKFGGYQCAQ